MKIAIIGAGNMGGALARGLARSKEFKGSNLHVANPHEGKLQQLKAEHPDIVTFTDNKQAVKDANWILLAVKPWKVKEVLKELKPVIDYDRQVLLSVAAGIKTHNLAEMLDEDGQAPLPIFYVMPNTAVAVGSGMTLLTSTNSTPQLDREVTNVFALTGRALYMDERLMDAGMMLSGCGIAYAMRYARASVEGGIELGLSPQEALAIVLQTMRGAADLLQTTEGYPEVEIDKVTTPGGITIRGLNAMEQAGFTAAVIKGLKAGLQQ